MWFIEVLGKGQGDGHLRSLNTEDQQHMGCRDDGGDPLYAEKTPMRASKKIGLRCAAAVAYGNNVRKIHPELTSPDFADSKSIQKGCRFLRHQCEDEVS